MTVRRLGIVGGAIALVVLSTFAFSQRAVAQARAFDLQLFLPPAAGGTTFTIDRPTLPRHLNAVFGLAGNYALEPFVRTETRAQDGTVLLSRSAVVRHLAQFEAMAALGLFEHLELGVSVPVAIIDSAQDADLSFSPDYTYGTAIGMGDVRLSAKIPLVRGDFALAARLVTHLPSGDHENFLGMDYWIATPSVVMAWNAGPLVVAAELGYRFRQRRTLPGFEQDDEVQASAGVSVPLVEEVELIGEMHLRVGTGGRELRPNEMPWEADVGVRIWPIRGLSIEAGVGTGIHAGYGAPPLRAFAALRFATERGDSCTSGPEDYDGFEDGDFCADLDNDGDGIPDTEDECPNEAGPALNKGCPFPDRDGDGVVDRFDNCPDEPGPPEFMGCPQRQLVELDEKEIKIHDSIYFRRNGHVIERRSFELLEQLANVINSHPEITHIRIEGHTDSTGRRAYNVSLSQKRARSVMQHLIRHGKVDRRRLSAHGFGPDRPIIADARTDEEHAANRRVEFRIEVENEP